MLVLGLVISTDDTFKKEKSCHKTISTYLSLIVKILYPGDNMDSSDLDAGNRQDSIRHQDGSEFDLTWAIDNLTCYLELAPSAGSQEEFGI